ncbi:MAG TPA: PDZ domain-containing protein [Gemmatimonadaceae bacterium]|nr:PDZ domain-containing protein [Gemmatimonadaceae bacterium]
MLLKISAVAVLVLVVPLRAQHPLRHPVDAVELRFAVSHPVVRYSLRVDSADLAGVDVEMHIRNAPDTLRLAMAAHPEYDDRFWRFVQGLRVETAGDSVPVVREDSALWRAVIEHGEALVRYRIQLPSPEPPPRAAWRPFLSPTGGLTGGPHTFMYLVGAELAPAHVVLELPRSWDIATGLVPTSDARTFFAPSVDVLVDSPIFAGAFKSWRFSVDGVPHRVIYWPLPGARPFDTTALVRDLEGMARQTIDLFGRAPYREYTFIFQDGAFGGLEHLNSVTIGAPSEQLAKDRTELLAETAHEFIHSWNLMRIRPAERTGVRYKPPPQTPALWWSEGLTLYYADLALRRGGLPVSDSTRTAHLESLIERYLSNPGNSRISPERASLFEYGARPGALGDYDPSVHLQGELLGAMLDLLIQEATAGRRSMDDVMPLMLERHSGERGFTGRDIERAVAQVCGCGVRAFFDRYVRSAGVIDFDRSLRAVGLRARVSQVPAADEAGKPVPDRRAFVRLPPGDTTVSFIITNPESAWGRAGLHTGDRIASLNGSPVRSSSDFRAVLSRLQSGDTVQVEVLRPAGRWRTSVILAPYTRPEVRIEPLPNASPQQRALRQSWLAGRKTPD